jgi:protein-L-isoaspartate(D-aspartate) O-methyltransferase
MASRKMKWTYLVPGMIAFLMFSALTVKAASSSLQNFEKQRERMVSVQIKARGITDENVLKAMKKVERHRFVGQQYRRHAYEDYPLPIGEGQTISQPYIVALMTQVLNLDDTKKVLEIGSGSGYQTAVLAEICHSVYTIEVIDALGKRAAKLLADMGYGNIKVKVGDGYQGWEKYSPFDAIIVTCAPTHVPQALKEQLAEGGRMIIPVGEQFAQELVLLTKQKGKLMKEAVIPVRFVPMMRRDGKPY